MGAEPVARCLKAQRHRTGHMRCGKAGTASADEEAAVVAGTDRSRPSGEHVHARGNEIGLAAAVPAGTGATEGPYRAGRVVTVTGTDDKRKVAARDRADRDRRAAVVSRE